MRVPEGFDTPTFVLKSSGTVSIPMVHDFFVSESHPVDSGGSVWTVWVVNRSRSILVYESEVPLIQVSFEGFTQVFGLVLLVSLSTLVRSLGPRVPIKFLVSLR